jgi:hypothetical protein
MVIAGLLMATAVAASAQIATRKGVLLLPSDETIAPFNKQFNLTGRTLTFTRTGASFSETTGPLQFDEERGTLLEPDYDTYSVPYTLKFDFPFFDRTTRTLHISHLMGIYLDSQPAEPSLDINQYGEAELVAQTLPLIAPLFTTLRGAGGDPPGISVKELSDRLVVTWSHLERGIDVQATLFSNGNITFSYRSIGIIHGGAVVITSGREAWRTASTELASAIDPPNDFINSAPPEIAAMIDIVSAKLGRLADSELLQVAIKTRGQLSRATLGPGGSMSASVRFGAATTVIASITNDGENDLFSMPSWSATGPTSLVRFEGDTITITFSQESLKLTGAADRDVTVTVGSKYGGDTVVLRARIDPPPRSMRTDFAAASSVASFSGPIAQTFMLPNINVISIWERVRDALHIDETQIDGVAMYQTFPTTSLFGAKASASVGNPGVDGVRIGFKGSDKVREPNVMQMNQIHIGPFTTEKDSVFMLLHEFGHRWLFGVEVPDPSGTGSVKLYNSTGHPSLNVDTRAAFRMETDYDCSVMGGNKFKDLGNGTFRSAEDICTQGYSWLDLYLMGLVAPEEVPPFFYLADSTPAFREGLMMVDFPYKATRRDVAIADVVRRMGPRNPAWPETQRSFKVLFILLYDPALAGNLDQDVDDLTRIARLFEQRFAQATGGRGSITTKFPPKPHFVIR